jgi:hypothetical protein
MQNVILAVVSERIEAEFSIESVSSFVLSSAASHRSAFELSDETERRYAS